MSLTTPYYEHDGITIYHGDCREIIPRLDAVDVIATDPPYGVSKKSKGEVYMIGDTFPILAYVMPVFRSVLKDDGAIYCFSSTSLLGQTLPIVGVYFKIHSLIIWDKRIGQIPRQRTHYKLRYEPIIYASKGLHYLNRYQDDVIQADIPRGKKRVHPTQKPTEVLAYLLQNSCKEKSVVLDPFVGSGTTLLAAKALKLRAIGIEIEERYCELAAKRLSQEVFHFA